LEWIVNSIMSEDHLKKDLEACHAQVEQLRLEVARLEQHKQPNAAALLDGLQKHLANFNHEFLTPLNLIQAPLELAIEQAQSDSQKQYLGQALASCKHLKNVVENMSTMTEVEFGNINLELKPFNIHDLIEDLVSRFENGVGEKHLCLSVITHAELPEYLIGDSARLLFVLGHLLDNAIKFTHEGHIKILIEPQALNEGSSVLRFSIADTGIGISREIKEKIFLPFMQNESLANRSYEGLGVGLSLCQHFVQLMGGKLKVESQIGEGSIFAFAARFSHQLNPAVVYQIPKALKCEQILLIHACDSVLPESIKPIIESYGMQLKTLHRIDELLALSDRKDEVSCYGLVLIDAELLADTDSNTLEKLTILAEQRHFILIAPLVNYESNFTGLSFKSMVRRPVTKIRLYSALIDCLLPIVNEQAHGVDEKSNSLVSRIKTLSELEKSDVKERFNTLRVAIENGELNQAERLIMQLQEQWPDMEFKIIHEQLLRFDFDKAINTLNDLEQVIPL